MMNIIVIVKEFKGMSFISSGNAGRI